MQDLRRSQAQILVQSGIAEKAIAEVRAARSKTSRNLPNEVLPLVMHSTKGSDSALLVGLRYATRDGAVISLSRVGLLVDGIWSLASKTAGYTAEDLQLLIELANEAARTLTQEELELGC